MLYYKYNETQTFLIFFNAESIYSICHKNSLSTLWMQNIFHINFITNIMWYLQNSLRTKYIELFKFYILLNKNWNSDFNFNSLLGMIVSSKFVVDLRPRCLTISIHSTSSNNTSDSVFVFCEVSNFIFYV